MEFFLPQKEASQKDRQRVWEQQKCPLSYRPRWKQEESWLRAVYLLFLSYVSSPSLLFAVIVIFTSTSARVLRPFPPRHTHYTPLQTTQDCTLGQCSHPACLLERQVQTLGLSLCFCMKSFFLNTKLAIY